MIDRYTKVILTIIALALVALVAQNSTRPAVAQLGGDGCGSLAMPCYIATRRPIDVSVVP